MLVYLRIDVTDNCNVYTAYNYLSISPSYVWRYTNYQEGMNYLRTNVHRSLFRNSGDIYGLGVF